MGKVKTAILGAILSAAMFGFAGPALADTPVYRLFNSTNGDHHYTADANERASLINNSNWCDDGIAWQAPGGGSDIYRLYNPSNGDHLLTCDLNEYNTLPAQGWRQEGAKLHSAPNSGIPVYRLYNPSVRGAGSHLWTTDVNEYNSLPAQGWQQEGIKWYASGKGAPADAAARAVIALQGWWKHSYNGKFTGSGYHIVGNSVSWVDYGRPERYVGKLNIQLGSGNWDFRFYAGESGWLYHYPSDPGRFTPGSSGPYSNRNQYVNR